jgi:hypothetical protein
VLFELRFVEPIRAGEITLTFRRWKRRQAAAGRRQRTVAGFIEVDAVDVVEAADITDADAKRSGYPSAAALLTGMPGTDDLPIYRIAFHHVDEPDPRAELQQRADLSADERAELDRRLDRLDNASSHGPWTRAVLALIGQRPAVRAGDLADAVGQERLAFKADVRKLKNLGLTISLEKGYRLSPRGQTYLNRPPTNSPQLPA